MTGHGSISGQHGLRVLPAIHDLPPSWDGALVTWKAWLDAGLMTARLHCKPEPCEGCGSLAAPLIAAGLRDPEPGATVDVPVYKRTRSGKIYAGKDRQVPAWPCIDLHAQRCPDCGLDIVTDQRTGEVWTLDESDYGDAGSREFVGTLW